MNNTKTYLEQDLPGHQIGRQAQKDEEQGERQALVRHVLQLCASAGVLMNWRRWLDGAGRCNWPGIYRRACMPDVLELEARALLSQCINNRPPPELVIGR